MGISVGCDKADVIVESYSFGSGVFCTRGAAVVASLSITLSRYHWKFEKVFFFFKKKETYVLRTCFSNLRRPPVALFNKPEVNSSKELKDAGPVSSLRCDVLSAATEFSKCRSLETELLSTFKKKGEKKKKF